MADYYEGMARPKRKCAFCDAWATTKGEHLWDDWINKELPKKTRFNAQKTLTLNAAPIEFETVGLKEKLPVVCAKCNGGWMSALTAKVKKRFSESVVDGKPFSLDARDASLLVAYTFLKASVKDYCYSREPFFTRAERESLRTSLVVPPVMSVWFAAHLSAARYTFHSNVNIVSAGDPGPLRGMKFFCYTYIIGRLVLQLLAPGWENPLDRARPLVSLNPGNFWVPAATQFWPYLGKVLSWPPENFFGDDTIEQFFYRFRMSVEVPITILY